MDRDRQSGGGNPAAGFASTPAHHTALDLRIPTLGSMDRRQPLAPVLPPPIALDHGRRCRRARRLSAVEPPSPARTRRRRPARIPQRVDDARGSSRRWSPVVRPADRAATLAACLVEGLNHSATPIWLLDMTIAHDPDDVPEFDLTEVESYLGAQTSRAHSTKPTPSRQTAQPSDRRTRRVRRLADDVEQARQLVALQDSPELVSAHSRRVLRTIRRSAEAVKLVQLRQNPAFIALATVRARKHVTATGLAALVIALGWSTAGVQSFAAGTAARFSTQWWFAWGVEPFVSLALLTIVIGRAFLASRGQFVNAPTVRRTEWLFLSATLVMNTWGHLPYVATPFRFDQLIIHMLGPVVAVCVVIVLPLLWVAIDDVPEHQGLTDKAPTSVPAGTGPDARTQERVNAALSRANTLIRNGQLPPRPSANQVYRALGGAMDTARAVRDILRRDP